MLPFHIPLNLHLIVMLGFCFMAVMIMIIRLRVAKKPATIKKILIPPLGMSTGFLMFLYPPFQIPWSWTIITFITGAVFLSLPLILTSKFHIVDQDIYLKPSRAFTGILITLLVLRLVLHSYIEQYISLFQTGSLFFILAFGMLLPWRIAMYVQYKKLYSQIADKPLVTAPE